MFAYRFFDLEVNTTVVYRSGHVDCYKANCKSGSSSSSVSLLMPENKGKTEDLWKCELPRDSIQRYMFIWKCQ